MQIGRLFGVPLRIDGSWLFVFALMVWTLSANIGPLGAIPPQWRLFAASLTVLAFFAGVVAHELSHALVGRRYGIKTREVVLFVFGGVSRMDRVGTSAWSEAMIALAGPALSLILGLALAGAAALLPSQTPAFRICAYLAIVNIVVAAFNLLPAYPLDGGRVVHAIAWHLTHSRIRATKIASVTSSVAGILLVCAGALLLVTGFAISGLWIILIAWFIMRAGQAEFVSEIEIEPLKALRCGDLADPPGAPIDPNTACGNALEIMANTRRRVLPISTGQRFLGLLTLSDFAKTERPEVRAVYVSSIMTPVSRLVHVTPEANAFEALEQLSHSDFHQLPVISDTNELIGFVTTDTIRRAVAFSLERQRLGMTLERYDDAVAG